MGKNQPTIKKGRQLNAKKLSHAQLHHSERVASDEVICKGLFTNNVQKERILNVHH